MARRTAAEKRRVKRGGGFSYNDYERIKRELQQKGLSPKEYEEEIKNLCTRNGV